MRAKACLAEGVAGFWSVEGVEALVETKGLRFYTRATHQSTTDRILAPVCLIFKRTVPRSRHVPKGKARKRLSQSSHTYPHSATTPNLKMPPFSVQLDLKSAQKQWPNITQYPKRKIISGIESSILGILEVQAAASRDPTNLLRMLARKRCERTVVCKASGVGREESTWTSKVCKIMVFWAIFGGFGLLFYILFGVQVLLT